MNSIIINKSHKPLNHSTKMTQIWVTVIISLQFCWWHTLSNHFHQNRVWFILLSFFTENDEHCISLWIIRQKHIQESRYSAYTKDFIHIPFCQQQKINGFCFCSGGLAEYFCLHLSDCEMADVIHQNKSTFFRKKFISRSGSHILIIYISETQMINTYFIHNLTKIGRRNLHHKAKITLAGACRYQKNIVEINVGHCDLYFMGQWFCLISWRLFAAWASYFGIMSQYDTTFDLKINVSHCDLYFMVQWFCLISWLFDIWSPYFGIMSQYDPMFDLKINVGHCDLYFIVQCFWHILKAIQ